MVSFVIICLIISLFLGVTIHWVSKEAESKLKLPLYFITVNIALLCYISIIFNFNLFQ